jgi:cobalt-zinc-cadmium efflux system membrane fusion protein
MKMHALPLNPNLGRKLTSAATLLAIVGIGYFGHHTGWSLPALSLGGRPDTPAAVSGPARETAPDQARVEFPSLEAVRKSGITVVPIEERSMIETVAASGSVTYDQRHVSRLSTRTEGTVWSVEKHWGDAVRKGEVLAIVEAVEIGKLKADFLNQMALVETRAETLRIITSMSTSMPQARMREANFLLREARIRLANAEQTLVNMGLPLRMADFVPLSDEERTHRLQFLGLPESLTARLDPTETTTNLVPIVAPFDGIVIGRDVGVGEWTEPSRSLFEVANVNSMWLKLDVAKEDAGRIRLGQHVRFRGDGMEADVECSISWISTEVNENTRTLQVRAEVQNPEVPNADVTGPGGHAGQRMLRANTFGVARIRVRESPAALAVPRECLQSDLQGDIVFVRESDCLFRAVPVAVGLSDGQFVEISGELMQGAEVARKGSHVLKSQFVLRRLGADE